MYLDLITPTAKLLAERITEARSVFTITFSTKHYKWRFSANKEPCDDTLNRELVYIVSVVIADVLTTLTSQFHFAIVDGIELKFDQHIAATLKDLYDTLSTPPEPVAEFPGFSFMSENCKERFVRDAFYGWLTAMSSLDKSIIAEMTETLKSDIGRLNKFLQHAQSLPHSPDPDTKRAVKRRIIALHNAEHERLLALTPEELRAEDRNMIRGVVREVAAKAQTEMFGNVTDNIPRNPWWPG